MSYVTLCLPFNVDSVEARRLLSTAWLFKIASHRMLRLVKQFPILPATDIGWKNTFRKIIYELIPNRRYTDGVIVLVRGIYESCRQLGINFKEVDKLKLLWIRNSRRLHKNYNWKVITLRSSIIEMVALKAPLYKIKINYVNPRGTTYSREHDEVMKKHRLDKHTASAYMIALKGLNHKFI